MEYTSTEPEATNQLEAVFEAMADGIFVYDGDGRLIKTNTTGRQLLGGEELYRSPSSSLQEGAVRFHLRDAQGKPLTKEQWPVIRILQGEEFKGTHALEVMVQALDGQERFLSLSGSPIFNSQEQIVGAVIVVRDVTERKRIEEELRKSEERYRTIVQTANEGIWLVDANAQTIYTNELMATMLGYTMTELTKRTLLSCVFPEDEAQARTRIGNNLLGYHEQFEFRFCCNDGHVLDTLASTSPIRDETGAVVGALGLFTDITARKRVEQALKHSEELLGVALRNAPIAVFQQDRDLRYTWMYNPPSFTVENIVGKTDADFVSPENARHLAEIKRHVLTSGEGVHEEIRILSAHGVRWELLTIEPLRDQQGVIIGITGTSINITERKHLEEERERLAQQAHMRASELEAIFEAMTDAVVVFDTARRVVQMNPSAKSFLSRFMSITEAEQPAAARQQQLIIHDEEGRVIPEDALPALRLLRGETLVSAERQDVVITTYEGDQLLLNIAGAPLRDVSGKQIGAVAVIHDITERRRLAQRTHRALEAFLSMAQIVVQQSDFDGEPHDASSSGLRKVAQQIAALTRDVLGCERLSLQLVEPGTELLYPLAIVGLSTEQERAWWAQREQANISLSKDFVPAVAERLRQQEVVALDLTQPPFNEMPNPYGIHSMLIAPLYLNGQLLGLLQLDHRGQAHIYTDEEIALTQAACRLVALVIEREQLLAKNQRLSELIELAHDAVLVRDPESRILFWNQGAEHLYGWTEQEARGNVTHTLFATRSPLTHEAVDMSLARDGQWEGILTHTRRDGDVVIVESRQVLIRDATGKISAILEINRDITEREQLAQERAEAQATEQALRETNRLMDEFIGIAGHELRTPLTTVKASVQLARRQVGRLLKQDDLPANLALQLSSVQGHLDRTERQIAMQNRLVSDLLDVSRIHSGRLELHPDLCDLVTLVREVVEDQQYLTPERKLNLSLATSDEILVLADADRVRQVVSNYLSNALKYSEVTKPVEVSIEIIGMQVRVAVRDEGPGISEEQQQYIWERFYRVPGIEVRTGSGVGLGLGLHISRMIIERQRGQVGIESEPEHGSTFWFMLPVAETT